MKIGVKRTMVYLPSKLHKDLKRLAVEQETSVAQLIREATEILLTEDIEDIAVARERLEEYRKDPSSAIGWEAYKAKRKAGRQSL